ncbi:glycoside hydrolase family 95 protein [Paenibacillus glycanilyticus]|uniref:glycoside hydrolase family 95 protein n=1 Tax=Paenibacillus glycanilyticus TaxID=126569 RepID=UPI00203E1C5D|nr:glycoside hydrolase family 95 protein [Paenibacillus glycanilyticus]MCM3627004.1 glycoside hydrolase family 95 protein [Paenibacillus glycanilyticus]
MGTIRDWKLWYEQPAALWEEALPIGNGRIGGMVFAGTDTDQILLNEDTLWAGFPRDPINYEAQRYLAKARQLIFSGKYVEAEKLIESTMQGRDVEPYLPLGGLSIVRREEREPAVSQYRRELHLNEGIAATGYQDGDVTIQSRYFASVPDQVLVVRYEASGGTMNRDIRIDSLLQYKLAEAEEGCLHLIGQAPSHVAGNYHKDHPLDVLYEEGLGLPFEIRVQVETDGIVTNDDNGLQIRNAAYFNVYLATETGFAGYNQSPDLTAFTARCLERLQAAAARGFEALRKRHVEDHRCLFDRVSFSLSDEAAEYDKPTDRRLADYQTTKQDPHLEALYFHFGRYLLMGSSRPGTQPANLQGIWNHHVSPPWHSDYTININTQMNYWPAEACNLSECHEPLFTMLQEMSETGSRTARIHYGSRGWTAHHNVDLWRMTTPTGGSASWAFWPLGGAWLVRQVWESYLYNLDKEFLGEQAYPLLKGAALFCLDWLIEGPSGDLVTNPSTSPENKFLTADGEPCSVSYGSTMDIAIIRDLFHNCLEAIDALGMEEAAFRDELLAALDRLPSYKIGRHGQLQEWYEDFEESEPGHRHVSHLYGIYPGKEINEDTPELLAAAVASLDRRLANGGGHTGWSCAWLLNLFARLKDKKQAYGAVQTLLARSTYPNLLDAHPPFQIDGNFGGSAGIAELLLQSHLNDIELLPALPAAWRAGQISGLKARGGYKVSIEWADGKLKRAVIEPKKSGICQIRYEQTLCVEDDKGAAVALNNGGFEAEQGRIYYLSVKVDS